jgi:hypothetical protein
MKIEELTETQYNILNLMCSNEWGNDYCYSFRHFDELNLTKKELSKEFKILREAGLVYFTNGLMTEEGEVCGSGYGLAYDSNFKTKQEIDILIKKFEEKKMEKEKDIVINIGQHVFCDLCNEDYSNSEEKGGFIFMGKAFCPKCAPEQRKRIREYNESYLIQANCPHDMSFKEFVLRYRKGNNKIILKGF